MGPTWGPSGADRSQVGHMLTPRTLLSGNQYVMISNYQIYPLRSAANRIAFLWKEHIKRINDINRRIATDLAHCNRFHKRRTVCSASTITCQITPWSLWDQISDFQVEQLKYTAIVTIIIKKSGICQRMPTRFKELSHSDLTNSAWK